MNLVKPFIPTLEEIAYCERRFNRSQIQSHSHSPSAGISAPASAPEPQAPGHGQSTGHIAQAAPAAASATASAAAAAPYMPYASASTYPGQRIWGGGPPVLPPRAPLAPRVIKAADFLSLKIPRRPALLDRWLCEGDLGYIFAPRGVGKTWMALALPYAISQCCGLGLWAPGQNPDAGATTPRQPVPVLYVDGEMPLELTQYRANGLHMENARVDYLHHESLFNDDGTSLNIGDQRDREALTTLLVEQEYKVLILDNLSSLASGIDENKGTDYEPIAHWLLELRRRKITVILVHHAGRNGFMRGHTKREDACSWILELRDAKQEGDTGAKFISHFAKPSRNTGEPLPDLLWHFTSNENGQTHIHCELAQVSDYEQFIQHVVEGVTSQRDIADMMSKNKGTISKWARKALEDGRVSGSVGKLLPPSAASSSKPTKTRVHANDDEGENDDDWAADFRD